MRFFITFIFVALHKAFELGHIRSHNILHEFFKADFFFGAQFFEDGARLGAGFKVTLMARQLHPRVFVFVFTGLEERRPLNDISQLAPSYH